MIPKKRKMAVFWWGSLILLGVILAGLSVPVLGDAEDQERIISFNSDITVNPDASMVVRETIKVQSTGEKIKRGFYRDFPVKYRDRFGNMMRVGFQVLEIRRDGGTEAFHISWGTCAVAAFVVLPDYLGGGGERSGPGNHYSPIRSPR
jgi:hypothetical protein